MCSFFDTFFFFFRLIDAFRLADEHIEYCGDDGLVTYSIAFGMTLVISYCNFWYVGQNFYMKVEVVKSLLNEEIFFSILSVSMVGK